MEPPDIAAFDFDGTCTRGDTTLPLVAFVLGRPRLALCAPRLARVGLGHALGWLSTRAAKEGLYRATLAGMGRADFEARADRFARERVAALVRPEALARVAWHRRRGHPCVLVTAALRASVASWASAAGFCATLGSELEADDRDRLTGRQSHHCDGPEKVDALRRWFGGPLPTLHAYGDSVGDRELLALADHPHLRHMPGEGPP